MYYSQFTFCYLRKSLNFSYKEGFFRAIFVILQRTITSQNKHNILLQIKHVHVA